MLRHLVRIIQCTEFSVINSAEVRQKTIPINANYNHDVVVQIVEGITLFISGFVQPFESEIQALFNDFQAFHTTISST